MTPLSCRRVARPLANRVSWNLWHDLNTSRIITILIVLIVDAILTPFVWPFLLRPSNPFEWVLVSIYGALGTWMAGLAYKILTVEEPQQRRESVQRIIRQAREVGDWCLRTAHADMTKLNGLERAALRTQIETECVALRNIAFDCEQWMWSWGVQAVRDFITGVEAVDFTRLAPDEAQALVLRQRDRLRRELE